MDAPLRTPQPIGIRVRLPCLTCGQPIRFALAPYRLELDPAWTPRGTRGAVSYTVRVNPAFARAFIPSECEACRLARATDDAERAALAAKLAELEAIAARVGLTGTPFTMQEDRQELRDDRTDLAGFSVTSYGVWFLPLRDVSDLEMRFVHVQLGNEPPLLKLYPLEVIMHPDIPAELHMRWDPATGRVWEETIAPRRLTVEQRKHLAAAGALYQEQRPLGRGTRTGYFATAHDFHQAKRDALADLKRANIRPTVALIANRLCIAPRTYHDYKRKWGAGE